MSRCFATLASCERICYCAYFYAGNVFCCDGARTVSAWNIIRENIIWIVILIVYIVATCPCSFRRAHQPAEQPQEQPAAPNAPEVPEAPGQLVPARGEA